MSERKYIDESFVAGATDYITKPFDFFELRSRLSAAQRMNQEHARASDSVEVARKLKKELDSNLMISLSDPVAMTDIERMLGHSEFENYVMQLGQTKRFSSYVMALKIVDIERHHEVVVPKREDLAQRAPDARRGAGHDDDAPAAVEPAASPERVQELPRHESDQRRSARHAHQPQPLAVREGGARHRAAGAAEFSQPTC